jgi:hypothetical protein
VSQANQLQYARAVHPGKLLRAGTQYVAVYAVVRHEATGTVLVCVDPDQYAAGHEAQRWQQDSGVPHTTQVATLIITPLPVVGDKEEEHNV